MTRGEYMRAARKEAGWMLSDLADAAGVSRGTLSQLERDMHAGSIETIMLLADVLGLTIDEYVGHYVCNPTEPRRTANGNYVC